MLDTIDRAILELLQANARISNADIARQLDMAPSAILDRIRKLEQRGIIRGYTARIDPASVGLGLTAFILVRTEERVGTGAIGDALARIPEVLEVHHVAGEDCYLVKVRVPDTEGLSHLLRERFGRLRGVRNTRSTIVLSTVKESQALSLVSGEKEAARGT
jgi:Lrp/AsnC family leucine-responsive transcriptional regulator